MNRTTFKRISHVVADKLWWQVLLVAGVWALCATWAQAQSYLPDNRDNSYRSNTGWDGGYDDSDDVPRPGYRQPAYRDQDYRDRGGEDLRFHNARRPDFSRHQSAPRPWEDRNDSRSTGFRNRNDYGSGWDRRNGYGDDLGPDSRIERIDLRPGSNDSGWNSYLPGNSAPAPSYLPGNNSNNSNWNLSPAPAQPVYGPAQPGFAPANSGLTPQPSTYQDVQNRITRRYQNNGFRSLLQLSPQQVMNLYAEVQQMIDTRHLEPSPMSARVQTALVNLEAALENPAFLQVNQVAAQNPQWMGFRQALQQTAQTARVQSQQEAAQIMTWAMQTGQQMGLNPSAVGLEFVCGAVESLDKYSAFVPPERSPGASLQLENSVVGIGVQIEMKNQGALVQRVMSNSPAAMAGLQKNDVLVAVAGQNLAGLSADQAVELITGPAGTQVVLAVQRGNQGPFAMTIARQPVALHSVNDVQMLGGPARIGYFRLEKFTAQSAQEVESALQQLHQQGMQSLVMDLRGNPGGLLNAAVDISNKFLPQGTIVSTRGRNSGDNSEEHASHDQTWKVPLVVLVDHDSASASEIFAAAIQDNKRGVIVGRPSYGKGTVQTQFPLQSVDASVRLTTARFYAPSGRPMAGQGVTPDVAIPENQAGNMAMGGLDQDVQSAAQVAQQMVQQSQGLTGMPNMQRAPLGY